ncbi:hypothetical protein BDW59DRAFT_142533 [Aspergillus cavernicola]|uniref:BZIP domain-containing protein n=1 Tax=Aspergillus cavernicola TaxID=176166 RepID=A0ABR4IMD3_9EURO
MSTPNMAQDQFDFSAINFGDDYSQVTDAAMYSPHVIHTGIMATKDSMAAAPPGTVSPQDLYLDASAPPSTSFTDLSTPSFESPGYFSQNTSPMFGTENDLVAGHEDWGSLFPQDGLPQDGSLIPRDESIPPPVLSIPFDQAVLKDVNPPVPASPTVQPVSSPLRSPKHRRVSPVKPSTVAGVAPRARRALPAITIDESDPILAKRARNTQAARKSRARKVEREEELIKERDQAVKARDEALDTLQEAQKQAAYWKAVAIGRAK